MWKPSTLYVLPPGGYYLTSAYASLCLIQSLDQERPLSGCLTPEAQEALKEWSCRRSREAQRQKESQQNQVGTSDRQHRHAVVCSSGGPPQKHWCVGLCSGLLHVTRRRPVWSVEAPAWLCGEIIPCDILSPGHHLNDSEGKTELKRLNIFFYQCDENVCGTTKLLLQNSENGWKKLFMWATQNLSLKCPSLAPMIQTDIKATVCKI